MFAVLAGALILALGGDAYLLNKTGGLRDDIAQMRDVTQVQFTKLGEATTAQVEENRHQIEAFDEKLKSTNDATSTAVKRARFETQRQGTQLTAAIEDHQQKTASELAELKDATTEANSKLTEVSTNVGSVKTDVDGVKAEVASSQTEIKQHGSDLKRVMGDMGVMSGLIATNSKDLDALRLLGERNYVEFSLAKGEMSKKVGDVTLTFKKSDPKRNRYTIEVLADDKRVEKKDRTINEPVQIYISGNRQPYEIVVNQVKKDQVAGYLATPKVSVARR
jgi:chromosome segregation ATPase